MLGDFEGDQFWARPSVLLITTHLSNLIGNSVVNTPGYYGCGFYMLCFFVQKGIGNERVEDQQCLLGTVGTYSTDHCDEIVQMYGHEFHAA